MTIDIKNFYLITPMIDYEYMKIKYKLIPTEIKSKYNQEEKMYDGDVYIEIQKGMYGLK